MEKINGSTLPVYIYNSVEDEWQYISCLETVAEQNERILLSNAYADSYLFANAGRKNFLFVSPVPISPEFRTYFEKVAHSTVTVLTPIMATPFICNNTVKDEESFRTILLAAKNYREVALHPYATTKYVYLLKAKLEQYGIRVILPESPIKENAWTVPTFGSKNGFRSLIDKMDTSKDGLLMPEGRVFSSPVKAGTYASELLKNGDAILLKTGKGSGGHGTYVIRKQTGKNNDRIVSILKTNPQLWKKHRFVVERFIDTDPTSTVKFPSVEGYVDETGAYRHLYTCNMLITSEGNFFGMEVGPEAISKNLEDTMKVLCQRVGLEYAKNGYRGHFDIDMILGRNGQLYMDESNVRNTGGTDAYKITWFLLGPRLFRHSFILSKFIDLPRKGTPPSFTEVVRKLSPLLYSHASKTGLILSSEAALKEFSVTYFIIARTKKEAYEIEKKLFTYFHYQ